MIIINRLLLLFLLIAPNVYFLFILYILKKDIRRSIFQIISLILISIIFLNKLILGTQTLAQKDFNNIQVPLINFFHNSITNHFLPPIWDSTFAGGYDVFSNPLSSYFSVFNWIFLLGDNIYYSLNLYIVIQIILCSVFSYLMLINFKFSKGSSFLGSILFTFNGFVTMRLSQGVGIEYLYSYKWLPLILLFSKKYLENLENKEYKDKKNLLGLAISLAMTLEGNLNMVISIGFVWLIFLISNFKTSILLVKKLFLAVLIAFGIYAIKIVPFLYLTISGVSRLTGTTSGWRQGNIDLDMLPKIFLPLKFGYDNAIFTPGIVGLSLAILGLLICIFNLIKYKKYPFEDFTFVITLFITAFLITIENPIYNLFFSLPVLKGTTQIPSFLILYLIPLVFFATYLADYIQKSSNSLIKSLGLLPKLAIYLVSLLVFLEIIVGPSTFGNKTYSFNFPKMEISESTDFPHYNLLAKQETETFIFDDMENKNIFFYPYSISLLNLRTLNSYRYFFGSNSDKPILEAGSNAINEKADYVLSLVPKTDTKELELLGIVSMSKIKEFDSQSVIENRQSYMELYITGWNDDIFIYKVNCRDNCAIKNYSFNPTGVNIKFNSNSYDNSIPTTISYSKFFRINNDNKHFNLNKDEYGYTFIEKLDSNNTYLPTNENVSLNMEYINPYIYYGFIISLVTFVLIILNIEDIKTAEQQ